MPITRDPTATKDKILSAAFDEFTAHGFAGARVDDIATRAGCNKALLYHHFGDKEALFRNVLECKMAILHDLDHSPDRVPQIVGEFFDLHAANPWISRLMSWEALDFGMNPVPNERERARRFSDHVAAIATAQDAGTVDPSLDPKHILVSLIGLVVSWFAFPQIARMITGGDPYSKEALKRRRAHVVETARRMLEVR